MSGPCANCGAVVPNPGKDAEGRTICCIHCVFNPLGCRCEYGEIGVAETRDWTPPDMVDLDPETID